MNIQEKNGNLFTMGKINCMIDAADPYADIIISNTLINSIMSTNVIDTDFVFFCIGTTQVTGDSLGPLIGSQLEQLHLPQTTIYGTLEAPVHALNLEWKWQAAKKKHPDSCFIAIDASFGPKAQLGNICVENCPVHPGRGVGKCLPPIGDISITGVVCQNCVMRHRQLEHTPFSSIQRQANTILHGIFQTLLYFFILRRI